MLKPLTLKNGLTLLRIPQESPLFTIAFVVPVGYSIERDNYLPGICSIIEKLFTTGTDKHPSVRMLKRACEAIGAVYETAVDSEMMSFTITVPQENQYKAIALLAEIIQHSQFDPKDIDAVKRECIEQLRSSEAWQTSDTVDLVLENIFSEYGYGQSKYGTSESVSQISEVELLEFLQKQFNPKVCYVVVRGAFETKESAEMVSQEWGYWTPQSKVPCRLRYFNQEEARDKLPSLLYKQVGAVQTVIAAGFLFDEGLEPRVLRETSEEARQLLDVSTIQDRMLSMWATHLVLSAIIGQGLASRLWLIGVEEEAVFDDIGSEVVQFSRSGFMHISGSTDSSQFTQGLEIILRVCETMRKVNCASSELDRAKEYIHGVLVRMEADVKTGMLWISRHIIASGLTFVPGDLYEKISKVDPISVRKAAENLFVADRFILTTLGTGKDTAVIEKLVSKYLE